LTYSKLDAVGDIWEVRLGESGQQDGNPERLITSTRLDLQPTWSPDGERIAYVSTRSGSRELWGCRRDGSGETKLTSFGSAHNSGPAWSPDGQRIAFASDIEGSFDLWTVDSNGDRPERLTTEAGDESGPAWSPDGRWIYFTSNRDGPTQIWRMPSTGGQAIPVTSGGGGGVRVSPDGKHLYYARQATGVTPIWVTPAGGGDEVEVLGPDYAATDFAVTGTHIYFIPAADPEGRRILIRMDLATRHMEQVSEVRAGSSTPVCNCERWAGHGLAVSPDGQTILLGQLDYINSDIMLVENFR
jgi:Tol biopolymer transport system component